MTGLKDVLRDHGTGLKACTTRAWDRPEGLYYECDLDVRLKADTTGASNV
jgi:hypothetical protein